MRTLPVSARLIFVLAAGTIVAACRGEDRPAPSAAGESFRPLAIGDTVPRYAALTIGGDSVRVGSGESLTLVNVWATWCEACREEMADLEDLQRQYAPEGLRIVAVSVDEGDGVRVRRFVAHEHLTMQVVHDPASRVQEFFQTVGVPESYLIAPDGQLLWHRAGGIHGSLDQASMAMRRALDEAKARS